MDTDGNAPGRNRLPGLAGYTGACLSVADQTFCTVEKRFIRKGAALIFKIVICFYAVLAVNGVGDDIIDLGSIQKFSVVAPDSMIAAVTLCPGDGVAAQDKLIERFNQLDGTFIHQQK